MHRRSPDIFSKRGFTFVEMLVAISLSAIFLGTGALAMYAVSQNAKHFSTVVTVTIGESLKSNFYGISGDTIRTPACPNLGRIPLAQEMRDRFLEDVAMSEGIYCLARSEANPIWPDTLAWPYPAGSPDRPTLDTNEAFRKFLASAEPSTAGVFLPARNLPPKSAPNTSIFLLGPSNLADALSIQAIYEIDYVPSTLPEGTYASVRRYKSNSLTHYYDVFYQSGTEGNLLPSFVAFESENRKFLAEGDAVDRFKLAPRGPFFLIWWPDPTVNPFTTPSLSLSAGPTEPLAAYGHLAGKTAFAMAVPMFPTL